jgi:hypothetical protein
MSKNKSSQKVQEFNQIDKKLQGILEYYFVTLYNQDKEEIRRHFRNSMPDVDPDMAEKILEDIVDSAITNVSMKVHYVLQAIVAASVEGLHQEVTEFEVLLVDLVRRKLIEPVKQIRGDKESAPINIIISDKPEN